MKRVIAHVFGISIILKIIWLFGSSTRVHICFCFKTLHKKWINDILHDILHRKQPTKVMPQGRHSLYQEDIIPLGAGILFLGGSSPHGWPLKDTPCRGYPRTIGSTLMVPIGMTRATRIRPVGMRLPLGGPRRGSPKGPLLEDQWPIGGLPLRESLWVISYKNTTPSPFWGYFGVLFNSFLTVSGSLTLPMRRPLSSKAQGRKEFWKPSEPCHVGIHWKALAEYSQMSTMCYRVSVILQGFCIILCRPN